MTRRALHTMNQSLVNRAPLFVIIVTSLAIAVWATCPLTSSSVPNAITHGFKLATIYLFALTCEYASRWPLI